MAIPKTKEQLDAEVPKGHTRLDKDTKVIATETGYDGIIREPGDVFYVKKGTIVPDVGNWFRTVADNTATKEETDSLDDMTVAELKAALADKGVDFAGITKKADLIDLHVKADAEGDLA